MWRLLLDRTKKIQTSITKKKLGIFLFFVIIIFGMTFANPAYAVPDGTDIANFFIRGITWILLTIGNLAMGMAIFFLRFFVTLAGYNNYIDTPIVVLGWAMVRDLANMFFIVALLVMAFGTILGIESYEWRKGLVKLILVAVFINFSNMICQLIIDVAHVFTMTFLNAVSATAGGNLIQMFKMDAMLTMVRGAPEASNLDQINLDLLGGAMMMAIFAVIVALTIGAYTILMLFRMVVLWIAIILSPLAFVFFVLPGTKEYANQWWSEFKKHVLVAPIAVFFLWLAFATLGQGNIIGEIEKNASENTKLVALQGQMGMKTPAVSSSGISDWTNMATLIVALAFLWIGLEKVQELGVRGSEMVGKAQNFGKMAAMGLTGYTAGRWLAGKGAEGAKISGKFAGRKFLAKSGLSTVGSHIAAKYQIRRDQFKEDRAQKAKGWEAKGGLWNTIRANLIQPEERANKKRADYKRAAELARETMEENLGTSSTRAGKLKAIQGRRRASQMVLSEGKKAEKEAKLDLELKLDFEKKAGKEHGAYEEALRVYEQSSKTDEDKNKLAATKANYEKALSGVSRATRETFAHKDLGGKRNVGFSARARGENLKKEAAREEEIAIAKERDSGSIVPQYLESVLAKHAKEDAELAGATNLDRSKLKLGRLNEVINSKDKNITDEERKKAMKEKISLLSVMQAKGAAHGTTGTNVALEGLKGVPEVKGETTEERVLQQQARELSSLLGRAVQADSTSLNEAFKQFIGTFESEEKAHAYLQNYKENLNNTAEDGAVDKAGLFREKLGKDGKFRVALTDTKDPEDVKFIKDKRDYALSQSKATKIAGFDGSIDKEGGKYKIETKEAVNFVASTFGSVSTNMVNQVDQLNIDTFNDAFNNMEERKIKELLEAMASNASDSRGIVALMARTNLKGKGIDVKTIVNNAIGAGKGKGETKTETVKIEVETESVDPTIKLQLEKISKVDGGLDNDLLEAVRKKIDEWNVADSKDHFENDEQIKEAIKQIKEERETK